MNHREDPAVIAAAVLTVAAAVVFVGGFWAGAAPAVYGTALAVGLASLAVGLRRYFAAAYPRLWVIEDREIPDAEPAQQRLSDVTPTQPSRRLRRAVLAAGGLLGLSLLAPVTSLGPRAGDRLRSTAWQPGVRLVTAEEQAIRPRDVVAGGVVTAWPQGAIGHERSAVILVRLAGRAAEPPTNLDWVIDGSLVAYSKICTHAGCPVGLFRERDNALFCPCHQTTFDAVHAATPSFGPAARPLPQLPLEVDRTGFLVARGDFTEPVGPATGWLRQ